MQGLQFTAVHEVRNSSTLILENYELQNKA